MCVCFGRRRVDVGHTLFFFSPVSVLLLLRGARGRLLPPQPSDLVSSGRSLKVESLCPPPRADGTVPHPSNVSRPSTFCTLCVDLQAKFLETGPEEKNPDVDPDQHQNLITRSRRKLQLLQNLSSESEIRFEISSQRRNREEEEARRSRKTTKRQTFLQHKDSLSTLFLLVCPCCYCL